MKKSKRKSKNSKTNENGKTMIQNLWGTEKAVLRGKFTKIQDYPGNKKNLKQSNPTSKELEKDDQSPS